LKEQNKQVKFSVRLIFSNNDHSNGDIIKAGDDVTIPACYYNEHSDDEIIGFEIIALPDTGHTFKSEKKAIREKSMFKKNK